MLVTLLKNVGGFLAKLFQNKELEYLKQLHQEVVRNLETEMGFLRSQLEYKDQQFANLLHVHQVNAGLIHPNHTQSESTTPPVIRPGNSWKDAQARLEKKYAKSAEATKEEEWRQYAEKNQSIIDGADIDVEPYVPEQG